MTSIPIFISISTPPYNKKIDDTIKAIYQLIDNYKIKDLQFQRITLGVTAKSHLKGFIHISNAIKKSFGGIVLGFPRDYFNMGLKEIAKPTLWNHIEGSMIYLSEKPLLIIQDKNIEENNGIFDKKNFDENKIDLGLIQTVTINFEDKETILNPSSANRKKIEKHLQKVYFTYETHINQIPIYNSAPTKKHRNDLQEQFFKKICEILKEEKVIFTNSDLYGFEPIRESIENSSGAVIFGFTQIQIPEFIFRKGVDTREKKMRNFNTPSIWNDIEGAMAYQEGFPLLILKENAMYKFVTPEDKEDTFVNGIFDETNHQFRIIEVDLRNYDEKELRMYIKEWLDSVKDYSLLRYFQK